MPCAGRMVDTNPVRPCLLFPHRLADPDHYLFWDLYHPTREFGQVLAERAATILPEPFAAVTSAAAAAALLLRRRRRATAAPLQFPP